MTSLAKAYDPQVFEKNIAEQWESSGAFRVDAHSNKPAFTISMPPPKATGQLHAGFGGYFYALAQDGRP